MMKTKNILVVMLLTSILWGCGKDEPTVGAEQAFLNKLTGTWAVGSNGVTVDGTDITDQYTAFSIYFNKDKSLKVFEIENGGAAFPEHIDSYIFLNEDFTMIERASDGVVMSLDMKSKTELTIAFSKVPDEPGGRAAGTFGEFEFNLVKE